MENLTATAKEPRAPRFAKVFVVCVGARRVVEIRKDGVFWVWFVGCAAPKTPRTLGFVPFGLFVRRRPYGRNRFVFLVGSRGLSRSGRWSAEGGRWSSGFRLAPRVCRGRGGGLDGTRGT